MIMYGLPRTDRNVLYSIRTSSSKQSINLSIVVKLLLLLATTRAFFANNHHLLDVL